MQIAALSWPIGELRASDLQASQIQVNLNFLGVNEDFEATCFEIVGSDSSQSASGPSF